MAEAPAQHKARTKSTRTNLPSEIRQDQILLAARRLFREKGYRGTSMQDIGDAVGLQKGSLYLHINSKEDLLFDIVNTAHQDISAGLEAIYELPLSPYDKLKQAIKHHAVFIARNRDALWVLTEDARHLSRERRKLIDAQMKRYTEIFTSILEEGMRLGQFRPLNLKVAAFAVFGMCNGLYRWYSRSGPLRAEEIADVFADIILVSLTAVPAEAPNLEDAAKAPGSRARSKRTAPPS